MKAEEISLLLVEYGFFVGQQEARKRVSVELATATDPQFDRSILDTLLRWVRQQKGLKDPKGYLAKFLKDGSWQEVHEDISQVRERTHAPEDSKSPDILHATPDNPYGWPPGRRKQVHAVQDHRRPHQWNPYRMSYNGEDGKVTTTCTLYGWEGVELSHRGGPRNPEVLARGPVEPQHGREAW